ncbi:MAG: hypothetical protein ABSE41_07850 [Bacteroidota bacterium]|jgi:hypothetical protein
MMKSVEGSVEAEIWVEKDGTVVLPAPFLRQLYVSPGSKVRVRVTSKSLSRDLLMRGVSEEEVERIGALQFEQRSNVVAFLASEGALRADKGFRRRIKRVGR